MLGIYFGDGDQFFDHHTWQLHESPYGTSDLEFKGALKGNARSVYSGLIKVEEGAQKTDAYQQNRNLVLSRTARADSIPNLEIAANDVRCTHGATVSQVEEEHFFYLQARGLPRSEAQNLIVEGFFRPVIDRVPVEEIQSFLETAIARKVAVSEEVPTWSRPRLAMRSIGHECGTISRFSRPGTSGQAAIGVSR